MEFVQSIIENNGFPVVTAFLLGLIVALHPCPLAANVAAMGYLAKDARNRRRVFANGLAYTAGRVLACSVLGVVLIAVFRGSGGMEAVGRWFGEWGDQARSDLYHRAKARMKARCLTKENIASAEDNALKQFYQMFKAMGYETVEVRFER